MKTAILIFLCFASQLANSGFLEGKIIKSKKYDENKHGLIALQLISNMTFKRGLSNWQFMRLENIETQKKYRIEPLTNYRKYDSQIFFGVLPVGKYKILEVYETSHYAGNVIMNLTDRTKGFSSIDPIQIDRNTFTDLGAILFNSDFHSVDNHYFQKKFSAALTNDRLDLSKIIEKTHPSLMRDISKKQRNTQLTHHNFVKNGLPHKFFYEPTSDKKFMMHKFGSISVKEQNGWNTFHTGYHLAFNTATKTSRGYILGGDHGVILSSDQLNGQWKQIDLFDHDLKIHHASYHEGQLNIDVLTSKNYLETYLVSENLDQKKLINKEKFKVDPPMSDTIGGTKPIRQLNGYLVKKDWKGFYHVKFNTKQKKWKKFITGHYKDFHISGYNNRRKALVIDEEQAYLIASPATPPERLTYKQSNFLKPRTMQLYKGSIHERIQTIDSNRIGPIEPYCSNIIQEISEDTELFLICHNGDVRVSTDGGNNWQIDYETGLNRLYYKR